MDGPAEALTGLRDVRDPPLTMAETLADGFLAVALGIALALLAAMLLRPLTRRTRSARELALEELARTRGMAPAERLLAQAHLLRRFGGRLKPAPELTARLRHRLYRRADGSDADLLDQELARLFRQLRS